MPSVSRARRRGTAAAFALLCGLALSGCQSFAPLPAPGSAPGSRSYPPSSRAPKGTQPPVARGLPTQPAPLPDAPRTLSKDAPPLPEEIPPDLEQIADAVPQDEPPSKSGNPDRYEALGEEYTVLKKPPKQGYFESGRASWYGKQFHGRKTASGERYDMFAMTAAHKTLRLPSYARVTNLTNGKSVVVKINDRGPFVKGRIVDVSYAAAVKLGLLKHGHADVTLEVLTPGGDERGNERMGVPDTAPRYLEVGRYADPLDAVATNGRLEQFDLPGTEFLQVDTPEGDAVVHVLRVGPFESFAMLEKARLKLQKKGIAANPAFE